MSKQTMAGSLAVDGSTTVRQNAESLFLAALHATVEARAFLAVGESVLAIDACDDAIAALRRATHQVCPAAVPLIIDDAATIHVPAGTPVVEPPAGEGAHSGGRLH